MNEVQRAFESGKKVEYYSVFHGMWVEEKLPKWNNGVEYRVKINRAPYYPIYCKSLKSNLVVMFTDRNSGCVIVPDENHYEGYSGSWRDHEDSTVWVKVKNPNETYVITNKVGQIIGRFDNLTDAEMFLSYFKINIKSIQRYLCECERNYVFDDIRVDTVIKE